MANGMNNTNVYRNEHYSVVCAEVEYHIVNNRTGVKEGSSEVLSSAISKSDVWAALLDEIKGSME